MEKKREKMEMYNECVLCVCVCLLNKQHWRDYDAVGGRAPCSAFNGPFITRQQV